MIRHHPRYDLHNPPDYAAMTHRELADDLERWAKVREGLNYETRERPLRSGNLIEAALRLRILAGRIEEKTGIEQGN